MLKRLFIKQIFFKNLNKFYSPAPRFAAWPRCLVPSSGDLRSSWTVGPNSCWRGAGFSARFASEHFKAEPLKKRLWNGFYPSNNLNFSSYKTLKHSYRTFKRAIIAFVQQKDNRFCFQVKESNFSKIRVWTLQPDFTLHIFHQTSACFQEL